MKFHRHRLKLVESAPFTRTRLLSEQPEDGQAPAMDATAPPTEPEAQPGIEPDQTPEARAEEPDDKALAITVNTSEGVADEFRIAVKNALVTIPPEIRKIVSDHGFSITITKSMAELETELEAPPEVPLSRLASIYVRNSKEIAIAESIKDEGEADLPTLNPAGVIRHAFGHAVDELAPEYMKGSTRPKFSDLESFKYAHVSDIGRLAEDKKKKLAFYVEDEDASRSECFAECFASLHEGGSTYTIEVMSQFFPAAMKQVKDTIAAIKSDTKMVDKDGDGIPDVTRQKDEPPTKTEKEPAKKPEPSSAPAKPAPVAKEPEKAPEEVDDEDLLAQLDDPEQAEAPGEAKTPEEAPEQGSEEKPEETPEEEPEEPESDDEDFDEDLFAQLDTPEEAAARDKASKEKAK